MSFRFRSSQSKGFTLIEMMVVIAIISILSAFGYSIYDRVMGRVRRAEAKMALSAIYTSEQTFFADQLSYTACLRQIGFIPEGSRRFYAVGFKKTVADSTFCGDGTQTCLSLNYATTTPNINCQSDTEGDVYWNATTAANLGSIAGIANESHLSNTSVGRESGITGPAFKAGASGNVRGFSEWHDQINIDHHKDFWCDGVSGCDP